MTYDMAYDTMNIGLLYSYHSTHSTLDYKYSILNNLL